MRGFRSYLMFTGKSMSPNVVVFMMLALAMIIAAKIVSVCGGNPEAWDFMHFLGEIMWVTSIMYILRGVFNANLKSAPGYRFFHSLPDSAAHFKRAIITANIILIVGTAIFACLDFLLFGNIIIMLVGLALFVLGWMNLFGAAKNFFIYAIPFFAVGFSAGFMNAMANDEDFPDEIKFVIFVVCVLVCVVGIAYSIINSKRLWEKEK